MLASCPSLSTWPVPFRPTWARQGSYCFQGRGRGTAGCPGARNGPGGGSGPADAGGRGGGEAGQVVGHRPGRRRQRGASGELVPLRRSLPAGLVGAECRRGERGAGVGGGGQG